MTSPPFFSILITAYNRAGHIERCVRSALCQTFTDFEVIVVDDASTDATPAVLASFAGPRVRVVRHECNRGISPARATAVNHAQGEWFVIVDSDWELYRHALARLRALIEDRPSGIHIIRSRLRCDDGSIQPAIMPGPITGYRERLLWMEELTVKDASSDAGHCIHRSVFASTNYFGERRGAMETLWETDVARREASLWVPDILGVQHTDATNSYSRDLRFGSVIRRLLREAPDELWMAETMLAEHGDELTRYAPHVRRWLLEWSTIQAFLAGDRRRGIRCSRTALMCGAAGAKLWLTLCLGLLHPRALACARVVRRRLQARHRAVSAGAAA